MRRIAIVGAGQAGLHLALGLRARGYDITLAAERTPDRVRSGPVLSTQVMCGPARALERAEGLNFWDAEVPAIHVLRGSMWDPGEPDAVPLTVTGRYGEPAHSVDQRVKMAHWLERYEAGGGRVEYGAVDGDRLHSLAAAHELTIVAAGRGDLGRLFPRDPDRSPYDRPQRALACFYLRGVTPHPELGAPADRPLRTCGLSGVGEVFSMPALTVGGPCDILLIEGVPGGPFDCWQDRPAPRAGVARALDLLRTQVPEEYALHKAAEPADAGAALYGALTPVVRRPVARLAPGLHVLGLADAVVTNDPVTGQGSNNAARAAASHLAAVVERGDAPFDPDWMQRAFDTFWSQVRHSTELTNLTLRPGPPPGHMRRFLTAAARSPRIAGRWADTFADPSTPPHWFLEPDAADAYVAAHAGPAEGPGARPGSESSA
ncbi:styrene monooxygenase/indole monooxygenase family protein [Streptomyces sp. NPDC059009]|uniref:styrene monooxygenase/indole monooxygenase family protein n=1 Tax=Streptomyces sp. NPDC059009 TaxID=3346694 RepID=UPI0036A35362